MKRGVSVFLLLCAFFALAGFSAYAEVPVPSGAPAETPKPVHTPRPPKEKPASVKEEYLIIDGDWDEAIPIHNGAYKPFIMDQRLLFCMELTMVLKITDYTGYPFGDWELYALDLKDNWNPIEKFRIEKEQTDGEVYTYDFSFWPPESFTALSICPSEKDAVFTLDFDIDFYAP